MKSRLAAATAAMMLALLGVAYYLTYEPAFEVAIRWSEGVTWDRRLDLERRFGLIRSRTHEGRTLTYDLVDTRPENIRALLERPEIEDGGVLDRRTFTVPADAPYGRGWMWLGSRWPALRTNRLVPAIAAACLMVIVYWARQEVRSRRKPLLRLLACLLRGRGLRVEGGERLPEGGGVSP